MKDLFLTIASIGFSYALIPQIIKCYKDKSVEISYQTLIVNCISLLIIIITYLTMQLYFSTFLNLLVLICWMVLLILKNKY